MNEKQKQNPPATKTNDSKYTNSESDQGKVPDERHRSQGCRGPACYVALASRTPTSVANLGVALVLPFTDILPITWSCTDIFVTALKD